MKIGADNAAQDVAIPRYACSLCTNQFKMGHGAYHGRFIRKWNVNVCDTCFSSNHDGIVPRPSVVATLTEAGVTPTYTISEATSRGLQMNNWFPVIATLSGAIVAGTISLLVHWLSNRHSMQHTKLMLAEERARWAIERRLDRLQHFYGAIEKLLDVTTQFRVQQAWQATAENEPECKPPEWVATYDKARGEWEVQLGVISRELLLLDDEIQVEYENSDIKWLRWLGSKTTDDGVQALVGLEESIQRFRKWVANRYRTQFEQRLKGADHLA